MAHRRQVWGTSGVDTAESRHIVYAPSERWEPFPWQKALAISTLVGLAIGVSVLVGNPRHQLIKAAQHPLTQTACAAECNCTHNRLQVAAALQTAELPATPSTANPATPGAAAAAGEVRLFVGVLSSSKAEGRGRRAAVRETWGRHPSLHRVLFFMARPVSRTDLDKVGQEVVEHGDIVMLPFILEDYYNITHQTLEMCRVAAADPAVTHMMKADDDSFVRVEMVRDVLRNLPRTHMYYGNFWKNVVPVRDTKQAWAIKDDEWAPEVYPDFAQGGGYVLTIDLVRMIAAGGFLMQQYQHRLFKIEDAAVGMWLHQYEQKRGVTIHKEDDHRIHEFRCEEGGLIEHHIWPGDMRCLSQDETYCCAQGKPMEPNKTKTSNR